MTTNPETPLDPLEMRRQQFAERLQDPGAHLAQVTLDVGALLRLGVLFDASFHGVSRFETRIAWEGWGISRDDVRAARLRKGRMILLPRKLHGRLRSLEVQMRTNVTRYGRQVTGFGGWWWVAFTAYDNFMAGCDRIDVRLSELKAEIIARRPELVKRLATDMREMAHEAWAAIEANRPAGSGPFVLAFGESRTFETREAFAQYMMLWASARFPTAEEIKTEVRINYRNAMLVTSGEIMEQRAKEQHALDELRARHDADRLEDEAREQAAQTVIAEQAARRRQLQLETEYVEAEQTAKIEAMHQAELERAREQARAIVSPLQDIMEQLQAEIYEAVVSLAEVITNRGHVMGRTADRARNLLDVYRTLNAGLGDPLLEDLLQGLRDSLDPSTAKKVNGHKYNADAALTALAQIRAHCQQSAVDVALRAGKTSPVDAIEF